MRQIFLCNLMLIVLTPLLLLYAEANIGDDSNGDSFEYIPLLNSLKVLLQHPDICNEHLCSIFYTQVIHLFFVPSIVRVSISPQKTDLNT